MMEHTTTNGSPADRAVSGMLAVERAVQVLNLLAKHPGGISLADLARASDIPMTTLHRLLAVLRASGLVNETATGLHTVGVASVVLARAFLDGVSVRDVARPEMAKLVEELGETCHLGILASVHIVYLEKVDSPHPIRMHSRVGGINPALTTAIGRAILAHETEHTIEEVLDGSERLLGLRADRQETYAVLDEVKRRGYSTDLQENEVGICCAGAPIFDHTNRVVAALSVSGPSSRFDESRVESVGARVVQAGHTVSRGLGWPGPSDLPAEQQEDGTWK